MGSDIESAREPPVRQLIAELAYQMWKNEGKPQGCDVIYWLQAEQNIMSCIEPPKTPLRAALGSATAPLGKISATAGAHS